MALRHRVGWDPNFADRSPWFWPLASAARAFVRHHDWPTHDELTAMYASLAVARGASPLRFTPNVRKEDKREGERVQLDRLYDARIARYGEVPTREQDWHDFFNALCFATFPRAKIALHGRQFAALTRRIDPDAKRLPSTRTKEQDALTLFDEGGAVVAADAGTLAELSDPSLVLPAERLSRAVAEGRARVVPFGHALFEHLVEGLRCPGGSTRMLEIDDVSVADGALLAEVDARLGALLEDPARFLAPREGAHLRLHELGMGRSSQVHF